MKRALAAALSLWMTSALAYNSSDATLQVQRYVSTVACEHPSDGGPQQFKAVQIADGMDEKDGWGAAWVVYWSGQMGCPGGNWTGTYFTIVEMAGYASNPHPVVVAEKQWPNVKMAVVNSFSVKNGILEVRGISYNDSDARSNPTRPAVQRFKYEGGQITEVK